MADGVYLFLDWQNVYMRARESFHERYAPFTAGQVDPVDLAHVLLSRGPVGEPRELLQVRIYRGIPDQVHDPKAYAAARRQIASWQRDPRVQVFSRVLRGYPSDWGKPGCTEKPREKGVDVSLALDVVTCGLDGMYDVGIVMSSDQDIVPALEYMDRRRISRGKPVTEVAAWRGDMGRRPNRITVGKGRPYCHWLSQADYWGVQDERDYTAPAPERAPGPPRPGPYRRR
ncbi:NYN domain-containing protein [Cellulomonas sp. ICMP 17802]|uniref:NYN domain-containing protein n=1 Tax=Cellulomonas sp. ICMP 17802 TaxID=3239199 RepID=UPI00351ABD57